MESLRNQNSFYHVSSWIVPKKKLFLFFSIGVSLLLTSCFASQGAGKKPPPIERVNSKKPDPIKQEECRQRGQINCEGNEDCEDICNGIFRGKLNREDCYAYSMEMVSQFENLLKATEDGRIDKIEEIGPVVLECMLDIDEREFAKAIRGMSKREAQKFALLILIEESFSEILRDEDDEFNILKQLLNELFGSSKLEEALSQEVEDDKTLLWLFAEYSESAWDWLDSYVSEECDGRDSEDCPGGESIGAYCNALSKSRFSQNEWEDFLSDAGLFEEDYKREVENEEYEYEITSSPGRGYVGDFRDYCELKADRGNNDQNGGDGDGGGDSGPGYCELRAGTNNNGDGGGDDSGPCPDSPSNTQILATVRMDEHGGKLRYVHPYFRNPDGTDPGNYGIALPAADRILLKMEANVLYGFANYQLEHVVFNGDAISFDSKRAYYIYIDGSKHALRPENGGYSAANGITHKRFYPDSTVRKFPSRFQVAIASDLNSDQCKFYLPPGRNQGGEDAAGVCGRTIKVRNGILDTLVLNDLVANYNITCSEVTDSNLQAITELDLSDSGITTLQEGDFIGLTALRELDLSDNTLSALPESLFDCLPALQTLNLSENELRTLPAGLFNGLSGLSKVYLSFNRLTDLPAGLFNGLTGLTHVYLQSNKLTSLPAGLFDGLTALTHVYLKNNSFDKEEQNRLSNDELSGKIQGGF